MSGWIGKAMRFAKSPAGKKAMQKAKTYASSPEGKKRLDAAKGRVGSKRGGHMAARDEPQAKAVEPPVPPAQQTAPQPDPKAPNP